MTSKSCTKRCSHSTRLCTDVKIFHNLQKENYLVKILNSRFFISSPLGYTCSILNAGRFDREVLSERRQSAQSLLDFVAERRYLRESKAFKQFFKVPPSGLSFRYFLNQLHTVCLFRTEFAQQFKLKTFSIHRI